MMALDSFGPNLGLSWNLISHFSHTIESFVFSFCLSVLFEDVLEIPNQLEPTELIYNQKFPNKA